MLKGEFNHDGKLEFYEVSRKPPDLRHLQSAMFIDRPDLWRKPKRNNSKPLPPEQIILL